MYLHIGEGIMVRKSEIITILDARKMMADRNSHLFFETFRLDDNQKQEPIKSFVLIDPPEQETGIKRRSLKKRHGRPRPIVLVSAIASTTLQKRFNETSKYLIETEQRLK